MRFEPLVYLLAGLVLAVCLYLELKDRAVSRARQDDGSQAAAGPGTSPVRPYNWGDDEVFYREWWAA